MILVFFLLLAETGQAQSIWDAKLSADAYMRQGTAAYQSAQFETALENFQQAAKLYHAAGFAMDEARALKNCGMVYVKFGVFWQTITCYEQALDLYNRIPAAQYERLDTLNELGALYARAGKYTRALEAFQEVLLTERSLGHRQNEGRALNNIGAVYYNQGWLQQALDACQEALTIAREPTVQDAEGTAVALGNIGAAYRSLGLQWVSRSDFDEAQAAYLQAVEAYQQSLSLQEDRHDNAGQAAVWLHLGRVFRELSEVQERQGDAEASQASSQSALHAFQSALSLYLDLEDQAGAATARMEIGATYQQMADTSQALTYLEEALEQFRASGNLDGEIAVLETLISIYEDLDRAEEHITALIDLGTCYLLQQEYEAALDPLWDALLSDIDERDEAQAMLLLGKVYLALENTAFAVNLLSESLLLWQNLEEPWSEAQTQQLLGRVYLMRGQCEDALTSLNAAIHIQQTQEEQDEYGQSLTFLGEALLCAGQVEAAHETLQDALALHQEHADAEFYAQTIGDLGDVWLAQDDAEQALAAYQESLSLFRGLKDQDNQARALSRLGQWHHTQALLAEAVEYYRQAADMYEDIGDYAAQTGALAQLLAVQQEQADGAGRTATLIALAQSALAQNDEYEAQSWLEQALPLAFDRDDLDAQARIHLLMGAIRMSQGLYAEAEASLHDASTLYDQLADRSGEAETLAGRAKLAYHQNQFEQAEELYQQALAIFRELENPQREGETLLALSRVYSKQAETAPDDEAQIFWQQAIDAQTLAINILSEVDDAFNAMLAWMELGDAYAAKGLYWDALEAYRRALGMLHDTQSALLAPTLYQRQADALDAAGQPQQAQTLRTQAAESYADNGQFTEALDTYEEIREQAQENQDAARELEALEEMAEVHERAGQDEEASETLEEAQALLEESSDASENLVEAEEETEETQESSVAQAAQDNSATTSSPSVRKRSEPDSEPEAPQGTPASSTAPERQPAPAASGVTPTIPPQVGESNPIISPPYSEPSPQQREENTTSPPAASSAAAEQRTRLDISGDPPRPSIQRSLALLRRKIRIALKRRNFADALRFLDQEITIRKLRGDISGMLNALQQKAAIQQQLPDADASETIWRIVETSMNAGLDDTALASLEVLLNIFQEQQDISQESDVWNSIGLIHLRQGRFLKAERAFLNSHDVLQAAGGLFAQQAKTANNRGLLYYLLEEYEQAGQFFHEAFTLMQREGDAEGELALLNQLALVACRQAQEHDRQNAFAAARECYVQAIAYINKGRRLLETLEKTGPEGTLLNTLGMVYAGLGQNAEQQGQITKAKAYYVEALKQYNRSLVIVRRQPRSSAESAGLHNIAALYMLMRLPGQALQFYRQALELEQRIGNRIDEVKTLADIGGLYERLAADWAPGEGKSSWKARLYEAISAFWRQAAYHYYLQSIAVREQIRQQAVIQDFKRAVANQAIDAYQQAILIAFAQNRPRAAFALSERARARTASEELGRRHLNLLEQIDAERSRQKQALLREMRDLRQALADVERAYHNIQVPLPGKLLEHKNTLALLLQKKSALQERIERKQQELHELLHVIHVASRKYEALANIQPFTLTQIQHALETDTTLLSYFVTPDVTLAFIISPDEFHVVTIPVQAQALQRSVAATQQPHYKLSAEQIQPHLQQLYDWLARPVTSYLHTARIGIIPHRELRRLAFHALFDRQSLQYFGDQYLLFELDSANIYPFIQKQRALADTQAAAPRRSLAALEYSPAQKGHLPGAKLELAALESLYANDMLPIYDATETDLRREAGKTTMLHLSGHGKFDVELPAFSAILLGPDAEHDGLIEVHDVYGFDLSGTELVFLSACQSGVGVLNRADDLIRLPRAFLYAGASSVIASVWEVDDLLTAEFTQAFYTNLHAGRAPVEALRQARQIVRMKAPHPRDWAGFVLTGHPGRPVNTNPAQK